MDYLIPTKRQDPVVINKNLSSSGFCYYSEQQSGNKRSKKTCCHSDIRENNHLKLVRKNHKEYNNKKKK